MVTLTARLPVTANPRCTCGRTLPVPALRCGALVRCVCGRERWVRARAGLAEVLDREPEPDEKPDDDEEAAHVW